MTDIYHAGIKGQRKGIRRYQYANGTYTPEGNLRYRPPKRDFTERAAKRIIAGTTVGELTLAAVKNAPASSSHVSINAIINSAKTALSNVNVSTINAGKHVVDAIMAVPAPVGAVVFPLIAIGTTYAVTNLVMHRREVMEKIKELPWDKIRNNTVSVGASAAGMALSTISGNPLPAVAGITLSSLVTMMENR